MSPSSSPWIGGSLPFPGGSGAAVLLVVVRLFVGAGASGAPSDVRRGASAGVEGGAGPGAGQGRLQGAGGGEAGWKGGRVLEAA